MKRQTKLCGKRVAEVFGRLALSDADTGKCRIGSIELALWPSDEDTADEVLGISALE
jgi:hypothetical protein